jgi:membrane-associated phospholipid phosphatase
VALYGVAICAGLFVAVLAFAYLSPAARHFDASALAGLIVPSGSRGETLFTRIATLGDVGPIALIALGLTLVALLRGRPRVAVAVLLLVGATSVSGQLLKAVLAYPRDADLGAAAFPSGHSTAAMTVALCGVLVAPARLRVLAGVLGVAFALGVGFGVISLAWHYPSDVLAGYLLAAGWTFAVVSGLLWLERRRPERQGRVAVAARSGVDRVAAVGLVAAVIGGAVVLAIGAAAVLATRRPDIGSFVDRHTAAVVVIPAIVVAAAVLLAAFTSLLRRSE